MTLCEEGQFYEAYYWLDLEIVEIFDEKGSLAFEQTPEQFIRLCKDMTWVRVPAQDRVTPKNGTVECYSLRVG